jgi:hypothetical protein
MSCLTDFIGLRSCTTEDPISGLWINDYPGMSSELLEKIASQDQVTYLGVWASVQRQAYQKLKTDIQTVLADMANARLDQVIFQTSKVFNQQWQQIDPIGPEAIYKGIFASIAGGKYIGLRVKNAYVYNSGEVPVDITIKYFQAQDCKLLYEKEATVAPGMNTIPINQILYSDFDKINIAQLVDCSNLPTLDGSFIDYGWGWFNQECATRFSWWFTQGWSNFPISAPLDYGIGVNWNNDNQSGIYWDAELMCSLDSFICSERNYLVDAWARLLCAEILRTKLASQRFNYFTQGNREITERNQATFLQEYQSALKGWARQLNLDRETLCFNCEDSALVQQVQKMP